MPTLILARVNLAYALWKVRGKTIARDYIFSWNREALEFIMGAFLDPIILVLLVVFICITCYAKAKSKRRPPTVWSVFTYLLAHRE